MPRLRAGRLSPQFRDVITHDVEKEGEVLSGGGFRPSRSATGGAKIALKSSPLTECNQAMRDWVHIEITHLCCYKHLVSLYLDLHFVESRLCRSELEGFAINSAYRLPENFF